MKWTEHTKPNKACPYDHIELLTPLGIARIEWKPWKNGNDLCVYIDEEFIDATYDLEEAKNLVTNHLIKMRDELSAFLAK